MQDRTIDDRFALLSEDVRHRVRHGREVRDGLGRVRYEGDATCHCNVVCAVSPLCARRLVLKRAPLVMKHTLTAAMCANETTRRRAGARRVRMRGEGEGEVR